MFKFGPFKKMTSKKVRLFALLILVLIIMAGGLVYALYLNDDDSVKTGGPTTPTAGSNTSQTSSSVTPTPTTALTPTPTPTPTPNNQSPTPAPVSTPTPIVFAVTGVTASADTQTVCTGIFRTVNFTGTITTNAAGVVAYYWLGSDGGTTAGAPLNFTGAGSQTVTTSWGSTWGNPLPAMNQPNIFERFLSLFEGRAYALPFPDPVTFWEQLVVTSPNATSSNQASFVSSPYYCSPT